MTYSDLKEEIMDSYTEFSYHSLWIRIMAFHYIGSLILENEKVAINKLEKLSDATNIDLDDLEYAIIFANKYPDLEKFNHDKTVNWHTIKEDLYAEGLSQGA